jgi:hypothetical protein
MNRARIAAELPADMAAWLHAHADDDLWDHVGRTVAVHLGQRLLAGDPGTNPLLLTVHRTADSQAVRHVADALGPGRRWSANRVAHALCEYLELYGAAFELRCQLVQIPQAEQDVAA